MTFPGKAHDIVTSLKDDITGNSDLKCQEISQNQKQNQKQNRAEHGPLPGNDKKYKNQNHKQKKNMRSSKKTRVPNVIPKKDHYQRISYLYKIGSIMAHKQIEKHFSNSSMQHKSLETLSRTYLKHMDVVGKKAVLKLHPDIKRTMCKKCSRMLVEGITCKIRLVNDSKKQLPHCDVLETTCTCGCVKRFSVGKDSMYTLFSERDGIIHEMETKQDIPGKK